MAKETYIFSGETTMKKHKENIVRKFTEEMQLPEAALSDSFKIEIIGTDTVCVEGCRGIVEYEEACIALNLGRCTVRFLGAELEIGSFFEQQAVIKGTVMSVEFSS